MLCCWQQRCSTNAYAGTDLLTICHVSQPNQHQLLLEYSANMHRADVKYMMICMAGTMTLARDQDSKHSLHIQGVALQMQQHADWIHSGLIDSKDNPAARLTGLGTA